MHKVEGIIVDVLNRTQFKGEIIFENGVIKEVNHKADVPNQYILPGFTDAHIHIESSMLVPSEFAKLAVRHGTVATVSDPHEIANVCGIEGVEYMIENGKTVPLKFFFGAPSCVPATSFETAGAELNADAIDRLMARDEILYLAEMMNWPGVSNRDPEVMAKIESALKRNKPVDGHAPGLKGEKAKKYASAGITTDHECFTKEEALDKIQAGMKIAIREGSAAKNYDALISLLGEHPDKIMFCSDDKHPDDLIRGHMNELAARTLALGYDLFDTLNSFCVLPVQHYNLPVGLLRIDDSADFIVVDDLNSMQVKQTWIDGSCVFDNGKVLIETKTASIINNFKPYTVTAGDFSLKSQKSKHPVIDAFDGELITGKSEAELPVKDGFVQADPEQDIQKIAVVNRYRQEKPAVGFIRNFGIRDGAIASSVAHDSHNIIVIGSTDEQISRAVNLIMEAKGGISAVNDYEKKVLPLPVGGIMTNKPGEETGKAYEELDAMAKQLGSTLKAPFMLISFMALLVIPSLKISDKGLFDGESFTFLD
jgi:adenine deaminase